jgi:hypothetical protein
MNFKIGSRIKRVFRKKISNKPRNGFGKGRRHSFKKSQHIGAVTTIQWNIWDSKRKEMRMVWAKIVITRNNGGCNYNYDFVK